MKKGNLEKRKSNRGQKEELGRFFEGNTNKFGGTCEQKAGTLAPGKTPHL